MAVTIQPPERKLMLMPVALCQERFAAFGDVIENPAPDLVPNPLLQELPKGAVLGNQGSALVYADISKSTNLYGSAPSRQPSKHAIRMFCCAPRTLLPIPDESLNGLLEVVILERHPYTSQTFIPLGLAASNTNETRYLVIVAPTLPPSPLDEELPVPNGKGSRGSGLPDITKINAFVVNGSQAVTYRAGTWHAPMIVIGKKPINFVVIQSVNGVDLEDCQEAEWKAENGSEIVVAIPKVVRNHGLWKL